MPRILGSRTGRDLGELNEREYELLMTLFKVSPEGRAPSPISPEAVERLVQSGASERLLAVVQKILRGHEDFEVDWEQDPD